MNAKTLWLIVAFLIGLWIVSVILKWFLGGLIHLLLVVAVVVIAIRLATGKKLF